MNKNDYLLEAWKLTKGFDVKCGVVDKSGFDIVDIDGCVLWVNYHCKKCGEKKKLQFQMTEIEEGAWNAEETGLIEVADDG